VFNVKVIADSISGHNTRITTLQMQYPRLIHAEFLTHRAFCLSGDSILEFDLPAAGSRGSRRSYKMTLREFAGKWHEGSKSGATPRHNGKMLEHLEDATIYTADSIAADLGIGQTNLNNACRTGRVVGAYKVGRTTLPDVWAAPGLAWKEFRRESATRRHSLVSRLQQMHIRQLNEATGAVQHSTVSNVIISGVKPVFRLKAGDFSVVATKDHQILTADGWKRLGEIRPLVDSVLTYKYGSGDGSGVYKDKFKKIDGKWVSKWCRDIKFQVLERQGHKCYITGEDLDFSCDIHHLEPRHLRPDLAFDINNVVAVTAKAHKELHKTQGWQIGVPLQCAPTMVNSITEEGNIDTYDLTISGEYPNFFANGVVVHNSRNSSSSRAIPVAKVFAQVRDNPAMPVHWGANQPGMQAHAEVEDKAEAERLWRRAANDAANNAQAMLNLGLHKQVANRVLEPYQWMHTIVTSTEWSNWDSLRDHPDADPNIHHLASLMKEARDKSKPIFLLPGTWHLPYIQEAENLSHEVAVKVSAARCARVSYLTHDGKTPSIEADLALFDRLAGSSPAHCSPLEHQATPFDGRFGLTGNFSNWIQFRKLWEQQL